MAKLDAGLARVLLGLLAAGPGGLTRAGILAAAGRGTPRRALLARLAGLVRVGRVVSRAAARPPTLALAPAAAPWVAGVVALHLPPRARVPGAWVRALAAAVPAGPGAVPPGTPAEDAILEAIRARLGASRGMLRLHELAAALGLTHPREIEGPLRRLRRAGKIQLDPLADPSAAGPGERELGIPDRVKGTLFFVSLPG